MSDEVTSRMHFTSTVDRDALQIKKTLQEGVPDLIDTEHGLNQAIALLQSSGAPVAIDTERAQGFRYDASAWLIQIRRQDVGTFLIDSHALPDLTNLSSVLDKTWILHSAGQDLACLSEVNMVPSDIFDTEVAARLVGIEKFSLRGVCESVLGVTLEKTHQRENWSIRPLPTDWLRYAAMDVELLPELQSRLNEELVSLGRIEWAKEEFEYTRTHPIIPKENRWENLKGLGRVRKPSQLAIVKELWEARESIARKRDISPSLILSSKGIIAAALEDPQTKRALQRLPDFRRPQARNYFNTWWHCIQKAHGLTRQEMPSENHTSYAGKIPPLRMWKKLAPEAVDRLNTVRKIISNAAEPLSIQAEVLLEPRAQRSLAWKPFPLVENRIALDSVISRLETANARKWQIDLVLSSFETLKDRQINQLGS